MENKKSDNHFGQLYSWKKGEWEDLSWKHLFQFLGLWAILFIVFVLPMILVTSRFF